MFFFSEFEESHEEEKSEILFEKRYFNYIFEKLRNHQNGLIVEQTSDEEVHQVLHTIAHIINLEEFYETRVTN